MYVFGTTSDGALPSLALVYVTCYKRVILCITKANFKIRQIKHPLNPHKGCTYMCGADVIKK